MTHTAKQIAAFLGYDSVENYFESLLQEYLLGNQLAACAEFKQLRNDSKNQFLSFLHKDEQFEAYNYFHQFFLEQ